MNKFLALSLLAFALSCSSKSQPAPSKGKTQTGTPPGVGDPNAPQTSNGLPTGGGSPSTGDVPLEGTWLNCQANRDENPDYLSTSLKTVFAADSKLEATAKYFIDADCKKPFDAASAEKVRKSARKLAEADAKSFPEMAENIDNYMKEQIEPYVQALLKGDTSTVAYKISALNAQGIGEFDITMSGQTLYYSYKKSGSQLWVSEGCSNGLEEWGFPGGVDPDYEIGEEEGEEEAEDTDNPVMGERGGFGLTAQSAKKYSLNKLKRQGLALSDLPVPEYCADSPKTRSDSFKDVAPLIKQ